MAGFFITFEGADAAGKTTQVRRLAERLEAEGRPCVITREPGGSAGAEALRELVLFGQAELSPRAEIMALFAARQDHVDRVIAPALAAGKVVICDRFTDSTRAYQGYGRAQGDPAILALIDQLDAMIGINPDLTLVLQLDRAVARARLIERAGRQDRFEAGAEAFHDRVMAGLAQIAASEAQRCVTLNADRPIDDLAAEIAQIVLGRRA